MTDFIPMIGSRAKQLDGERSGPELAPAQVDVEQIDAMQLPGSHQLLLVAVTLLVIGLFAWMCLSEVDIVTAATGRVLPDGRLKTAQAPEAGVIRVIHVEEGQAVQRGDLLFEFDPTSSDADEQANRARLDLATVELARIEAEALGQTPDYPKAQRQRAVVALQEQLRQSRTSGYTARIAQAEIGVNAARGSLRAAQTMVINLAEIVASTRDQERKLRPHVGEVVSRFSYESTRQTLLDKENELAMQRMKVIAAESELQAAATRIRQIQDEHRSLLVEELNEKRREVTLLMAEAQKIERAQGMKELRAPIDGYVQSVGMTTVGGVVTAAQTLATIVPGGVPLVIDASLSTADVGFVQVGQPVKVKLDAFPFVQYGSLAGVVARISPDAESASGSVGISSAEPAHYRVRVITDSKALPADSRIRIRPGMTAQVDITTGRRRLIQFFIQPLSRYWEDTVTMR